MKEPVTRLNYCQYLLVSQINYTLTNFADHCESFSHDAINRYLRGERITLRLVWDNVRGQVVATAQGYVVFDDTVLDKNTSFAIERVRRQYSGNAKELIKGIGVVTCVYVNPTLDQFWLIDYRLYDPEGDGKSKLDHVREMLSNIVYQKQLPCHAVLMDTGYATQALMLLIESLAKIYYCPLKNNRQVDDSDGQRPYGRVDALPWGDKEQAHGTQIKIKGFPRDHKVRLFRVEVSYPPHGLGRDQRSHSGFHGGHSTGVWLSLEDRAVAPRRQTAYWAGTLSVPKGAHPAQSYRLCLLGLGQAQGTGHPNRTYRLPSEIWLAR